MKFSSMMFLTIIIGTSVSTSGCSAAPLQGDRATAAKSSIYSYESDGNGFNTKNFFYDNGEEVVVFDTQFTPDTAQKSVDYIQSQTKSPITYVVITHPNPDKFNGMSVFQALGAKVIASNKTAQAMHGVHEYKKYYFVKIAKMFTEESYPKLSNADITFDGSYDLRLKNGERISLTELSRPGVSSNQTIASIPTLNAVMVGDLVHYKAHAWLEGGIVNGKPSPSISGWIADLNELRAMFSNEPSTIIYGGRGEASNLETAVQSQIQYLKNAKLIVNRYINKLGARKSELQGDQAQAHYSKLQKEFEIAFPDYALGYMIQYGIYGLVNATL